MLPICHSAVNKKVSRFLRICTPGIQCPASTRLVGLSLHSQLNFTCLRYALDAATGQPRWTFFTGNHVHFPQAVRQERVFAVSDDGFLSYLAAADGAVLWQRRGRPDGRM